MMIAGAGEQPPGEWVLRHCPKCHVTSWGRTDIRTLDWRLVTDPRNHGRMCKRCRKLARVGRDVKGKAPECPMPQGFRGVE